MAASEAEMTIEEWATKAIGRPEKNKDKIDALVEFFDGDIGASTMEDLATIFETDDWYDMVCDKDSGKPKEGLKITLIVWKKLNKALEQIKNGEEVDAASGSNASSPKDAESKNEDGNTNANAGTGTVTAGGDTDVTYPSLQVVSDIKQSRNYKKLEQFYAAYNPQKLEDPDQLAETLKRYMGKEDQLFKDLESKYILGSSKQQIVYRNMLDEKEEDPTIKILEKLADIYAEKIRPIEEKYSFPTFHTPLMNRIDFLAKPMVLLVGQYSVGKTSFIQYLVGRDFPGISIGPEPTTDSFFAVMHGTENVLIPGHTVPMQQDKPFKSLLQFGDGFLNKFRCAECNSPILESITFVDTPGILSGAKQRLGRNYDFADVIRWFAYRCDRILLLFDAHKLDISDEFKASIEVLKGHDDKIRCVLNKADSITNQQLLRVYGALMWSLGKVFKTPEVLRVYVGSFWTEPYRNTHNAELFDRESDDLISDLKGLPRHTATRKINEFMKRVRQLRVHTFICSYLKNAMPTFGKDKKKQELLTNLPSVFKQIAQESQAIVSTHSSKMQKKAAKKKKHNENDNDDVGGMNDKLLLQNFPDPRVFGPLVEKFDFTKFDKLDDTTLSSFDYVFKEIPLLLKEIPSAKRAAAAAARGGDEKENEAYNPFGNNDIDDAKAFVGKGTSWCIPSEKKKKYDNIFFGLQLKGGHASGEQVKAALSQYGQGLGDEVLGKIWALSYIDRRITSFDSDEFALALWLIDFIKTGNKLPHSLTPSMVPPSKRYLVEIRAVDEDTPKGD